ncbi:MAG: FliG C-terminal domain-containing protein [bacterium]
MKKSILKKWFWIPLILAILITTGAFAIDLASIIEQKIALERTFEDRLRGLLEKILGTDRFIVIVNVEPETEATEVARETWIQEKKSGEVVREEKRYVLPGVPVREKLGEEKTPSPESLAPGGEMKREYEKVVVLPKSFVRRVVVTIIVDDKIDETLIETVRAVAAEIMGLDVARGDQLIIKRQYFSEPSQTVWSTIRGSPIYWPLFAIVFLLFLLFPIRIFLRGLARIFTTVRPRGAPGAPPAQLLGPAATIELGAPERAEEKIGEKEEEKPSRPFDFINQDNLKHLLYLLKDETAETISVVISYLRPREATQVMASLPRNVKAAVTEKIARVRGLPPEVVDAMEADIKGRIDYIVGGTEQLVQIVDEADKTTREEILQSLKEKEPELAEKVRKQIVTFEDIANLDNLSFQIVLRLVDPGTVSLALRGTPEEFKSKIMDKLSEGAQAMLRQEMELGKPAGKQRIEEAQRKIVGVVRGLQREERITFEVPGEAKKPGEPGAMEEEAQEAVTRTVGALEEERSPAPAAPSASRTLVGKIKTKTAWIAGAVIIALLIAGFLWYQRSVAKKRTAGIPSGRTPVEGVKGG